MGAVLTLLADRFAPSTSAIGFLRLPLPAAAEGLAGWRRQLHGRVEVTNLSGDLPSMLRFLEPLTLAAAPKELLIQTAGEWTAYFGGSALGTDAVSTIGYLAGSLRCQGLAIAAVPHTWGTGLETPGRFGAVQFQLFGPEQTEFLNYVRTISVTADGNRWRFDANGAVQEFERTEAYSARRIRDRFTSEMLAQYCRALGVEPFAEEAYGPVGVRVASAMRLPPHTAHLTFAQAQARLGIVPGVAEDVSG